MCWNLSDCSQNNNLEQFKTLKYPPEREGWVTQVMWAAVSGAGDRIIVMNRGGSIINSNDDLHYRELSNKDTIESPHHTSPFQGSEKELKLIIYPTFN